MPISTNLRSGPTVREGGAFGLWLNMSPASTYAKSFIKLPLDEADAASLKLTN